jgi:hypothetical protein
MFYIIFNVSSGSQYFDVASTVDITSFLPPGEKVYVKDVDNGDANSAIYTVNTATYVPGSPGYTRVEVVEAVPAQVETDVNTNGDRYNFSTGVITLQYTDGVLKPDEYLAPTEFNTALTSLTLPGHGTLNYGESILQNLVHILENFASNGTTPSNPTIGQSWWDDADELMKLWDGATWDAPKVNIQTVEVATDTHTFVLTDAGRNVSFTGVGVGSPVSVVTATVPNDSTTDFPIGTQIGLTRTTAADLTIAAAGGVTINSADGYLDLRVQFSKGTLLKTAANTWLLDGDLSA